ncbi:hypothetical protein C0J52_08970 [Blattella germanica]|nr:hypothetical protein C0J52_08970 [Blattella germanica]
MKHEYQCYFSVIRVYIVDWGIEKSEILVSEIGMRYRKAWAPPGSNALLTRDQMNHGYIVLTHGFQFTLPATQ